MIAVGTPVARCPPGGRGRSPAPRLPQNVACRFPALRSSEVASQRGDSLQLNSPPRLYPCLRFTEFLAVSAQDSGPSGSLLLSRKNSAFSTSYRFSPAH